MNGPEALADLGRRYDDTLVGLERFARLLGLPSASLRARRPSNGDPEARERPKVPFPTPVGTQPRDRFLLGELVDWAERAGQTDRTDRRRVARFALECAVDRCARGYGSEATNRFVGGVAIAVAAGWRADVDDRVDVIGRLRTDPLRPPDFELTTGLERRGFVPDPHPAVDVRVRAATIDWRGAVDDRMPTLAIPDHASEGVDVVREVLATWDTRRDLDDFARCIDGFVVQLLRTKDGPSSTSPRLLAATMASLAPVRPGALVCDPACGEATTLIDLVERTRSADWQTIGITGREKDERAWTIAKIRLGVRSIAHRLGEPEVDSLAPGAFEERFDIVVCEPAVRKRNYRDWFEMCRSLLDEGGTAVLAVPAETLGHGFPIGSWWSTEVEHVHRIVLTPRDRRRTRGDAWAVCALGPEIVDRIDVIVATESTVPDVVEMATRVMRTTGQWSWLPDPSALLPMNAAQFGEIAEIAEMDDRPRLRKPTSIGLEFLTIDARPGSVADVVDAALGPWPRSRPGREWVSISMRSGGSRSDGVHASADEPSLRSFSTPYPEGLSTSIALGGTGREEDVERALAAVDLLRWMVDPDAELDGLGLDPASRNALAQSATEEVRRALKRFSQRLRGQETRGRPKGSPGSVD